VTRPRTAFKPTFRQRRNAATARRTGEQRSDCPTHGRDASSPLLNDENPCL
jgi:hypothetical protein